MVDAQATEFAARYGPWALIAGAAEGLGAALADQLAARGLNIIAVDYNRSPLETVATQVRQRHGVEVRAVVADLTQRDAGAHIEREADGLAVGLLIYVAGSANHTKTFLEVDLEYSLSHITLACASPVELVARFAPTMKERGRGGIVLVSSLACMAGSAQLAIYAAVKSFGVTFAEGLWAELRPHGVDVCVTPLGGMYTETNQRLGAEYDPNVDMLPADVAREIIEHVGDGPTFIVGETNQALAAQMWRTDRRELVELLSAGATYYANNRATS